MSSPGLMTASTRSCRSAAGRARRPTRRPERTRGRQGTPGGNPGKGTSMQLARVVGTVVATRKEASLQGLRLMVARPLDEEAREIGTALVAADAVGAGPDEVVLIAAGTSARQTGATDTRPVDALIIAIPDLWPAAHAQHTR